MNKMNKERRVPLMMNKKGSIIGKIFIWILGIAMCLILAISLCYSFALFVTSKSPAHLTAPTINPSEITLAELLYRYPGYNFNESDMLAIKMIYSQPKFHTQEGTLNRTLVYREIEKAYTARGYWARTKSIFTGTGGLITGTLNYAGFSSPRTWLDALFVFPIFFAAFLYVHLRRLYFFLKMKLNAPGSVSFSFWIKQTFKYLAVRRIIITFWILFVLYTVFLGIVFLKPLLIPLFSDYGFKAYQAYQSLTNISVSSAKFQVNTTFLSSAGLILIRSIATAVYIFFFFLAKEFIKGFFHKTQRARAEIEAEVEEEKQKMKDEQQVAVVKVIANLGKYMANPTKPD